MKQQVDRSPSPTPGLLAGLVISLVAVVTYSAYTISQISRVRELQQQMVDRNRRDSLQLLRIQDNLNSLGLAMRDMLDPAERYPVSAWSAQFSRIRNDLADAIALEAQLATARSQEQTDYLHRSLEQFWDAVDRMFRLARSGRQEEAWAQIRDSLQSRLDALSNNVARLLVRNNDAERQAGEQITAIYTRIERNVYVLLGATLSAMVLTGAFLISANRRLFHRISELSAHRSELSRRLITTQEDTFRQISRELHDEFGQVLTAIGAMLRRVGNKGVEYPELAEVQQVTQDALEKVRSLSQTLQPVILQEAGLLAALDWYLPIVERQTGISIRYEKSKTDLNFDPQTATHIFRILQEALNNVVRHSGVQHATVRIGRDHSSAVLEIEDSGRGITNQDGAPGIGLVAMRERAALIGGRLDIGPGSAGGTLVKLTLPAAVTA